MKRLFTASALFLALAAPVMAQDAGTLPGNPNASDRPSQRGLGSDDLASPSANGTVDGNATESILPPGSVDGRIAPQPAQPGASTGGDNASSGIGSGAKVNSGGSIGSGGSTTSGGSAAY